MLKIALISASGGVGRTTLAANLAAVLAQRGRSVLAVDFDPQNLLGLHLGMLPESGEGLAASVLAGHAWQESGQRNSDGVRFLPYGQLDHAHEFQFMQKLADAGDGWLRARLAELDLPPETITLIDTPRLPSIHAQQALHAADLARTLWRPGCRSSISSEPISSSLSPEPLGFSANLTTPSPWRSSLGSPRRRKRSGCHPSVWGAG
ncbi:MAG: cellulose synthase operon protein YhjQ/BcsQ, partial [Stenotrophobium sp.]